MKEKELYRVLYSTITKNKKKRKMLDGILEVYSTSIVQKNIDRKFITKKFCDSTKQCQECGTEISISIYIVVIDEELTTEDQEKELLERPINNTILTVSNTSNRIIKINEISKKISNIFSKKEDDSNISNNNNKVVTIKIPPNAYPLGKEPIRVYIPPFLTINLKEHQKEGINFMYKCLYDNIQTHRGIYNGCILADEMGLGKTLQVISLIYSLLTSSNVPIINKCIIVCPSTLIQNWLQEFHKWLGVYRLLIQYIGPHQKTVSEQKQCITCFTTTPTSKVLILSYEMYRKYDKQLQSIPSNSILVCDEGHRLKNANGNKTIIALQNSNIKKRILLTGTPAQNNLSEFYAMMNIILPGILGEPQEFRQMYEIPITRSKSTTSTAIERSIGDTCLKKLDSITSPYILRRTHTVISHLLPPKNEHILFIPCTALQSTIYSAALSVKVCTYFFALYFFVFICFICLYLFYFTRIFVLFSVSICFIFCIYVFYFPVFICSIFRVYLFYFPHLFILFYFFAFICFIYFFFYFHDNHTYRKKYKENNSKMKRHQH